MSRIFFGKFDKNKPEQIRERFYAAGAEGGSWYGGIQPGDYVFPVSNSKVLGLWRVREYGQKPNTVNPFDSGVVFFDEVKKFDSVVSVQQFIKSPFFELGLSLLNKISKSTIGYGFFEIQKSPLFPENIEDIAFSSERNIFIVLEHISKLPVKENDIVVLINNINETRIVGIETMRNGELVEYRPLWDLYTEKNPEDNRHTVAELLDYAITFKRTNKEKYMYSVLIDLHDQGYFIANNPENLYDNIFCGPPRNWVSTENQSIPDPISDSNYDEEEDQESLEDYKKYADLLEFNPNLILYGPPGTGKTHSVKKIIEAMEISVPSSKRISYEQVENEGRVKFVTFHQSYSYEEFVEGIRPVLEGKENEDSEGALQYKIQDGIIKQIEKAASIRILKEETKEIKQTSRIWKVSLGRRNEGEIL